MDIEWDKVNTGTMRGDTPDIAKKVPGKLTITGGLFLIEVSEDSANGGNERPSERR